MTAPRAPFGLPVVAALLHRAIKVRRSKRFIGRFLKWGDSGRGGLVQKSAAAGV